MGARIRAALVVVVVLGLAAFAVVSARSLGTQRPPTGPHADALAARTVRLLENDLRDAVAAGATSLTCAARPFGVRPERLTRAEDATTIYAWVYCRGGGRALSAPVALRLDGAPSVRVPGSDERSLERIFPADVRRALQSTRRDDLRAAVERRLS
jgi:hypothetical protein